jgi:NAD(P)-dependent dehydrogenase (short-subunit alcohol dehydrogenase family)
MEGFAVAAPSFDLSGRKALITGGSRGIGLAIAEAFVEHGAQVAIAARSKEEVEAAAKQLDRDGRPGAGIVADLGSGEGAMRLIDDTLAALGELDILVNNAGTSQRGRGALELDDAMFDQLIALNLRTPFILCREFARRWVERERPGRIINVSSVAGTRGFATGTIYAASKGGLEILTKSLALEWAKYNILVNSIAPGWVRTKLTSRVFGQPYEQFILNHSPMGRWGQPEEIAGIAVYLASDAASFTTGSTFVVDGAYSQY